MTPLDRARDRHAFEDSKEGVLTLTEKRMVDRNCRGKTLACEPRVGERSVTSTGSQNSTVKRSMNSMDRYEDCHVKRAKRSMRRPGRLPCSEARTSFTAGGSRGRGDEGGR